MQMFMLPSKEYFKRSSFVNRVFDCEYALYAKAKNYFEYAERSAFHYLKPLLRKHYEGMQALVQDFGTASLENESQAISLSTFIESMSLTRKETERNGTALLQSLRVEHNIILLMLDTELTHLRKERRNNYISIHFLSWLCSIHTTIIERLSAQLKKMK